MKFFNFIENCISVEDLILLMKSIEKDPKKFIRNLVGSDIIIERPDLIKQIEEENDFARLKVIDFIGYHLAKGNSPVKELIKVYEMLTKSIIPTAGFITGNFRSISFEQIPEHPIAKINFSEKKNVTIKAKNNVIELNV